MKRRDFLKKCAAAGAGGFILSTRRFEAHVRNSDRPNIVLMMADDHQARSLGCMGNTEILTPNLDALADKGVIYENCYASTAICMASRATTFLGMYEYKTGCNFGTGSVSSDDWHNVSYAVRLKEAGYRTAFAGKWGFPVDVADWSQYFDSWGGFNGTGQGSYVTANNDSLVPYAAEEPHVTRALGAFGRDFIASSANKDKPFCLTLFFKAPHKPHDDIDPDDQLKYDGVTFSEPSNYGQSELIPIQAKLSRQYYQWHDWDETNYQSHLKSYYQLISGVDTAVGMVIDELEAQGVADNTVIIYTSDNGYFCGSHGLQGKALPYEEGSRIPLIIYDPQSPSMGRNYRSKSIISNVDFAATVLDYAGVDIPSKMDGKSLRNVIDDPSTKVHDSVLLVQNWGWIGSDHCKGLAVVTEDHKYINWCYADENVPPSEELFDLESDPYELNDLSNDPGKQSVMAKMRSFYDEHHEHWSEYCVETEDYTRYRTIFDRNIPWQDKNYRGFKPGNSNSDKIQQIYEDLTGSPPPG